jgi:hypothetical protein
LCQGHPCVGKSKQPGKRERKRGTIWYKYSKAKEDSQDQMMNGRDAVCCKEEVCQVQEKKAMAEVKIVGNNTEAALHPLNNMDLLQCILPFVGRNQYRFVAAINHDFQRAYLHLFQHSKQTYYNVSTIQHVEITYECQNPPGTPCSMAAILNRDRCADITGGFQFCNKCKRHVAFFPFKPEIAMLAAKHGSLSMLMYTHSIMQERGNFPDYALISRYAAGFGQLHILDFVIHDGCRLHKWISFYAAKYGHLEVFQYTRMNDFPWDSDMCLRHAAAKGHYKIVLWAIENGCPWKGFSKYAALDGNLKVLQWARANGCPWDRKTCSFAAMGGHVAVLQWARANGCPWDERTCRYAAMNGHLTVLQWARANGCPWDERSRKFAAIIGRKSVLQWAKENGCP